MQMRIALCDDEKSSCVVDAMFPYRAAHCLRILSAKRSPSPPSICHVNMDLARPISSCPLRLQKAKALWQGQIQR